VRLLDGREVWHIARSVAKWTWRNTTAKGFSDWQAKAGKKAGIQSGKVRREASEDKQLRHLAKKTSQPRKQKLSSAVAAHTGPVDN
jgi:hypothetical protein